MLCTQTAYTATLGRPRKVYMQIADYTWKTGHKTSATVPIAVCRGDRRLFFTQNILPHVHVCRIIPTDRQQYIADDYCRTHADPQVNAERHETSKAKTPKRSTRSRVSSLAIPPTMIAAVCGSKYFCINVVTLNDSEY